MSCEVGQRVIISTPNYRHQEPTIEYGTVTKVARKYVTVRVDGRSEWRGSMEFAMDSCIERHTDNQVTAYLSRAYTVEQWMEKDRLKRAREVLNTVKLRFEIGYERDALTVEQYEAIAQIIDPEFVPGISEECQLQLAQL